jgi:hypothetical protein
MAAVATEKATCSLKQWQASSLRAAVAGRGGSSCGSRGWQVAVVVTMAVAVGVAVAVAVAVARAVPRAV